MEQELLPILNPNFLSIQSEKTGGLDTLKSKKIHRWLIFMTVIKIF